MTMRWTTIPHQSLRTAIHQPHKDINSQMSFFRERHAGAEQSHPNQQYAGEFLGPTALVAQNTTRKHAPQHIEGEHGDGDDDDPFKSFCQDLADREQQLYDRMCTLGGWACRLVHRSPPVARISSNRFPMAVPS